MANYVAEFGSVLALDVADSCCYTARAKNNMADIGGYINHVTGSTDMKVYYDACAVDCDRFRTGNTSIYRQHGGGTYSYDGRPSCKYPAVVYADMAGPEMVSKDTGSCGDRSRMSADCSRPAQDQTSSPSTVVEIYPWMKETRINRKHQRRPQMSTLRGHL